MVYVTDGKVIANNHNSLIVCLHNRKQVKSCLAWDTAPLNCYNGREISIRLSKK